MTREIREILSQIATLKDKAKALIIDNKFAEAEIVKSEILALRDKEKELTNEYNSMVNKITNQLGGEKEMKNNAINRIVKNAIYPGEKISVSDEDTLDLGKLVKGMAKGTWSGAEEEQKFFNMNTSGTGSVTIPTVLSSKILDKAREQSALFGKVPVVAMENNNLTIAIQTKDAEANFVEEGELIPTSSAVFSKVELNGKDLAIYVPITEKLLDSATNLEEQLVQSTAKAIAVALDKAMLYGTGGHSITGLENLEDVKKIDHTDGISYDFAIVGSKAIKKANITPTNIVYNSDFAADLEIKKDANGNYIERPKFMDRYEVSESNNIKENQMLIYDVNSLLLGMSKGITIQWGYSADDFQRLKKGLRINLRADFVPTRADGVVLVNLNQE